MNFGEVLVDKGLGRGFLMVPGTRSQDLAVRVEQSAKGQAEYVTQERAIEMRNAGELEHIYAVIRNPNDRFVGWIQRNLRDTNRMGKKLGLEPGSSLDSIIRAVENLQERPSGLKQQTDFWDQMPGIPSKVIPFEMLPDYVRTNFREYAPMEPHAWPSSHYKTAVVFLRGHDYDRVKALFPDDWKIYSRETAQPRARDGWVPAKRVLTDMEAV